MLENLEDLDKILLAGNFDVAYDLLKPLSEDKKKEYLCNVAIDTHTIIPYGFICYALLKDNNYQWHDIASDVLFCTAWADGAYNLIVHHAWEALKVNPTTGRKFFLLYFNQKMDSHNYLTKEQEIQLAYDVLTAKDKNSEYEKYAKNVMKKYNLFS